MVERVERLKPYFESTPSGLADQEALEQRYVPVVASGTADRAFGQIAPGAECGCGEAIGGKPLVGRMRVVDLPIEVGEIGGVGKAIAALGTAQCDVQRESRLNGPNAGQLPTADYGLLEAIAGMAENRNVIDEAHDPDMSGIPPRRT